MLWLFYQLGFWTIISEASLWAGFKILWACLYFAYCSDYGVTRSASAHRYGGNEFDLYTWHF